VLHGSNFGTCRAYAQELAETAQDLGFTTRVGPLDDHREGCLPTDGPVVVVAASYNGQPTDDARGFVSWLARAGAGAATGVRYAVLGVGDRNWAATYQQVPTLIDERLAAAGAVRLMERAEADASGDLAGSVRRFTAALRRSLLDHYGDPDPAASARDDEKAADRAYEVAEISGGPLDALSRRHGMRPMTVTGCGDLADLGHPSGRSKRFLRIRLPEGVSYRTADHLTILPANDPGLVERAGKVLGVDLDVMLDIRPHRPGRGALPVDRPVTVRDLLTRYVELQDPVTSEQVALLAARNPCPPERAVLERSAAEDAPDGIGRGTLIDLVEEYPALRECLDWPALLDLLPPIRPRHYSVSSSPATGADHADLMVSLLEAPDRSGRGVFRGVGSSYLHRLSPGDTVLARVQPCRDAFRIPHDERTPVVMVAAGTGLAPFRGAVADRRALREAGTELAPALCYFGCDHPDVDYLHRAELESAERTGAVSMRPAFSAAPEGDNRFVQHRILAEGDEVWDLIRNGARVHVCGDGARMAPGVREAFRMLYVRHTGEDEPAAERWLRGLVEDGRYVEDVYAAG
jgi:cytochrome P450/NADPH-cytochrome P450 reductase